MKTRLRALLFSVVMVMALVAGVALCEALGSGSCPRMRMSEMDLLSRLVEAEAGDQPLVCRVAVASVVLNRTSHPMYSDTIAGVIYEPRAFGSVVSGSIGKRAGKLSRTAACLAVSGVDPSGGAIKFWNPNRTLGRASWDRRIVAYIGDYFFGY